MSISRRTFLGTAALGSVVAQSAPAAGADPRTGMPIRILGKTGAQVSALGIGTGPTANGKASQQEITERVNRCLDLGITYVDTAVVYGDGTSEKAIGELMKSRRKEVWLATKIQDRNYDTILRTMDESLERLQTDQVDLVHIHNLGNADDLATIEAPQGPLEAFYKIRDQGLARYIGITSHTEPEVLRDALQRHDFDCVQLSLNAAHSGAAASLDHSFEKIALPVAVKKNMGILAMKVYSGGRLARHASVETLLRYSMSLPVSSAVVGMPTLEAIDENVRLAKDFRALPGPEREDLSERLRSFKAEAGRFFRHHQDA